MPTVTPSFESISTISNARSYSKIGFSTDPSYSYRIRKCTDMFGAQRMHLV